MSMSLSVPCLCPCLCLVYVHVWVHVHVHVHLHVDVRAQDFLSTVFEHESTEIIHPSFQEGPLCQKREKVD
jgi:hypothetical protein